MKRIIALLLTFLFLFACVSCKNSAGDETTAVTALTEALAAVTETETAEETTEEPAASVAASTANEKTTLKSAVTYAVTKTTAVIKTAAATVKATAVKNTTTRRQTTTKKVKTTVPKTEPTTAARTERRTEEPTTARRDNYCTISISCSTLTDKRDKLKGGKAQFVPSDGYILHEVRVKFTEGETAFDILKRVCAANTCTDNCKYCQAEGIQYEASYTPAYQSWYVKGIHQLYEKDCGAYSGWMYKVNGVFPNYGSSAYTVQNGDRIEWLYTCDLGEDIGY